MRAQSNPDLPVEDLEMEVHSRGLDRTASMRQESPSINSQPSRRLLHEEIALHWVVSTGQAREFAITHSWFFLELIVRSMVVTLSELGILEAPRKSRFSPQFCDDIATLAAALTSEVISRCGKENRVASNLVSNSAGYTSLLPLLYPDNLTPLKLLLLILHIFSTNLILQYQFKKSLLYLHEFLYISVLPLIAAYESILHECLFNNNLPFLPLALISIYCAIGVIYSWFLSYYYLLCDIDNKKGIRGKITK